MIIDHQTVFCTMIINVSWNCLSLFHVYSLMHYFGDPYQNTDAETKPYPREIMTWTEQIYSPAFDNCMKNKEDPEKVW